MKVNLSVRLFIPLLFSLSLTSAIAQTTPSAQPSAPAQTPAPAQATPAQSPPAAQTAPTGSGAIRGQVTDPSGAAITGATVVLTPATGSPIAVQTNAQGNYEFKTVAAG